MRSLLFAIKCIYKKDNKKTKNKTKQNKTGWGYGHAYAHDSALRILLLPLQAIYEQRLLEIEHSTFTPLVFSATGGMARQSTTFYKRLASLLAEKWNHPYSSTLCWVRNRLAFSLLRSAIQCIRGAPSSTGHAVKSTPPIDLVNAEAQLRLS